MCVNNITFGEMLTGMSMKKNGIKSKTFKLTEKDKLALDLKKKELKLKKLLEKHKKIWRFPMMTQKR